MPSKMGYNGGTNASGIYGGDTLLEYFPTLKIFLAIGR